MRVFVLTSGRTGSTSFVHASELIKGMTAGHETRSRLLEGRLDYPDNHIEADNRLVWFLGGLDARYDDKNTFYVHLTRNPERVALSYRERWHIRVSMVRAFFTGILMNPDKPDPDTALLACRLFVDTVEENIAFFLKNRTNWTEIRLEQLEGDFFRFMTAAGLEGDRDAIQAALQKPANTSKRRGKKSLRRFYARFSSRKLDID